MNKKNKKTKTKTKTKVNTKKEKSEIKLSKPFIITILIILIITIASYFLFGIEAAIILFIGIIKPVSNIGNLYTVKSKSIWRLALSKCLWGISHTLLTASWGI